MKEHTILLVDDEPKVLRLEARIFAGSGYHILTATNGPEALALMESQPVSLIISDHKMPGMTGVELLSEARRRGYDCARILLTGYADVEATLAAINEGWVHRFLTKPFDDEQLLRTVEEVLERFGLMRENRRLSELTARQNEELLKLNADLDRRVKERTAELEALYVRVKRGILGSVQMFSTMLENYNEALGGHAERVASLARDLAARLGLEEEQLEEVEIAARLHDVGLVCLPEHIAKATELDLGRLSEQDRVLFRHHPEYGQQIVGCHEQFTEIGQIIRAHHERYDGYGYPDRLQGEAIPLGARIIALASQYDRVAVRVGEKNSWGDLRERRRQETIQYLRAQRGSGLDPHLTQAFLEMLGERREQGRATVEVKLTDLRVGMILAAGISSGSGMLIIGPGTALQPFHLVRLESFNRIDPITQKIFVRAEERVLSTTKNAPWSSHP